MNKFAWEKEDIYFLGGLEKFLLSIPGSSILEIKQSDSLEVLQKSTSSICDIELGNKLPYEDDEFDSVFSYNVLRNMDNQEKIIRDSCRIAKQFVAHIFPLKENQTIEDIKKSYPDFVCEKFPDNDMIVLYKGNFSQEDD